MRACSIIQPAPVPQASASRPPPLSPSRSDPAPSGVRAARQTLFASNRIVGSDGPRWSTPRVRPRSSGKGRGQAALASGCGTVPTLLPLRSRESHNTGMDELEYVTLPVIRIIKSTDRRGFRVEEATEMIRCAWCGAENVAIDSWCASCSRHLDWAPPAPAAVPTPPPPAAMVMDSSSLSRAPRRRRRLLLAPAAAAIGVALVLAVPVAIRLMAAGNAAVGALPNT